jgi:hypothetical protein
MTMEPKASRPIEDDLPDATLFWRWVGKATRPVIGWILIGLAAVFILVGWIGVSGTPIVAKQIPFVVSGGIAGVFLAVAGAYFLGTEELRKDSGRLDRLERMVTELHAALLVREDAAADEPAAEVEEAGPVTAAAEQDGAATNGRAYVRLTGSDLYHRADCTMVAAKAGTARVAPSTIRRRSLTPCSLCEPAPVDVA